MRGKPADTGAPDPSRTRVRLWQRGCAAKNHSLYSRTFTSSKTAFMPAIPSITRFAIAPVAGLVVRGSQQPVMICHSPPPVSGVVGGVAPPHCVVVLG
uniref:Uncharacterized protein n=1 Tax=Pseudomonas putida (strain ATCC 700007 / DSM 6899 / JCM 31910 / BCRC 17059 / LMG 24140 / F1) TaxID=351746 RepID=A5W020_PSEP1